MNKLIYLINIKNICNLNKNNLKYINIHFMIFFIFIDYLIILWITYTIKITDNFVYLQFKYYKELFYNLY